MNTSAPVTAAGWTLDAGEAAGPEAQEFRALYRGEDFSAPRRGLLALVTRGDSAGGAPDEAAQVAARLFAEGFFGGLATLSPAVAAARALSSANSWLFRQSRADPQRLGMAASLCALACPASKKLLIVHLGETRAYLLRDGRVQPLTTDHLRPLPSGAMVLTRALGLDREAQADVVEIDARPGDRIILLGAALREGNLDSPPQTLAENLAKSGGAAVVVDIRDVAAPQLDDLAADFADLPIRPPPQEGDTLDGFVIGRTIYRGQYTLLKRARDTVENRDVALKLPLPAMAQDKVFHAGFLREAWIGARTRGRYMADYLDLPRARRSCLYLVMPYYHGQTLDARLKQAPPVSLAEGAGIAASLCDAVEDLARRQVVHRDIKPENIFLLTSGAIKLLDLGLAALPGLENVRDELGGTTRYMAPELFRGAAAGPRSEVFALGVTLYRMFSGGAFPFGRREAFPLARARPDLPEWLGKIIAQAINADPNARFADAAALRDALEHGLAHEDWRSPPKRPLNALMLWRALAGALALLCLFLLWRR
ncbi:hypothetical protein CCR94_09190 [Rhodoblastus sphagnicola]|uniref:Protein kinase domain-containing protein n=1 Tax=Rhodoblastus sphagnicola TaxID=333368 RepID=A0A2S6NA24_9HYPH|nr:bifunctional protein-serine/threonine kinase/phosphatase [Rhodoblastus sphagnicola]MBB4198840.1 hypothetical protein [Rhodoblastus sphagnicola]PPQ31463.1 hypothetical protein CCR94_09190 [Rhodoblastus sphagnicola]